MKKYLVFDRDGTLIDYVSYLTSVNQVKFVPGLFQTIRELKLRGYCFGIATNQSVIGRRLASLNQVNEINNYIATEIELKADIKFDFIKLCPHLPEDACMCRKPKPGLILDEIERLNIDCARSFIIGDSVSDVEFGMNLAMGTILIRSSRLHPSKCEPDYFVEYFSDILDFL